MYPRNDDGQDDWVQAREAELLAAALPLAPVHGWTDRLVRAAAARTGLSRAEAELILPQGPRDLAALLARRHDEAMLAALADVDPSTLKIRERIGRAVRARLDAAARDEAAVRRWAGYLSLPHNVPLALSLVWRSADAVWRWAGDTATDENHYSKRAILGGILISTLAIRLSRGRADAETFLDGRIADVMAFERWKAGVRPLDLATELAGALGRLRYGRPRDEQATETTA
jgi:ubiquinone biosynthesis protein COQ9